MDTELNKTQITHSPDPNFAPLDVNSPEWFQWLASMQEATDNSYKEFYHVYPDRDQNAQSSGSSEAYYSRIKRACQKIKRFLGRRVY